MNELARGKIHGHEIVRSFGLLAVWRAQGKFALAREASNRMPTIASNDKGRLTVVF
jgi:hypothetical protein